ncbi:MAG: 6,7-dimethyl-8-ribityllumazine synthase [Candidatus Omnitrophica bacterium]|nr:6,7-dimethyl-8-ribityllumazine synthase [Candidatus Omnitrophota bacterium]MBU1048229.1 6,7-dimethyl-8-ribityllumazine synthase [Candidatus Omnitrophota bacterium]MBU1630987.1 6,7-dimethyl-8-ribityllumazine synthase [Candidatus Omnitrophota bacterium]MBU1889745.1 6,7-dimethyl-8-ribityllumazine synthase [Candidatus Omnitrophota bacterium]
MKTYKADLVVKGKKIALICSRFNEFITGKLLDGAIDTLTRHGAKENELEVFWVPGSFEIPYLASKLAQKKKYDAIICLGTVIKGDTSHWEHIAKEVTKGIAQISLATGIPVIYGILTPDTLEQAIERAGTKSGNKGRDAALAAIEMVNLFGQIK